MSDEKETKQDQSVEDSGVEVQNNETPQETPEEQDPITDLLRHIIERQDKFEEYLQDYAANNDKNLAMIIEAGGVVKDDKLDTSQMSGTTEVEDLIEGRFDVFDWDEINKPYDQLEFDFN